MSPVQRTACLSVASALAVAMASFSGCTADTHRGGDRWPERVARVSEPIATGDDVTFAPGTLIVPMDTDYQDFGMFEAFGLVYQLLLADIPVSWVIARGKSYGDTDFTASATDLQTGAAVVAHGYRGGPFVIEADNAARARPIVDAWQLAHPDTAVHSTTAPFVGHVRVRLVAAPTIAMFADGNQKIARRYVSTAGIPDSVGDLGWPDTSPDMLDPEEVAGPTTTSHQDGALFDEDGDPAYCQMMSMHWGVGDSDRPEGREVVAEYREFLQHPVHLFAECQAVNAIENNVNGHFLTPNGFEIGGRPSVHEFFNADLPFAQLDGAFESVGGSEPSYSLPDGDSYLDGDIVMISGGLDGSGTTDVWMTGFVTGACSILSEFCDPDLPQGKVSYLGGHSYKTDVPISDNPDSQGARIFLNSLFEAPCATDRGQPTPLVFKDGPPATTTGRVTYTLSYSNSGPGVAARATLVDTLGPGVAFVSATGGGTFDGTSVTWDLGNLGDGETGAVSVTVMLSAAGAYTNSARLDYRSGLTPRSLDSNTVSTCFDPAGDFSDCAGSPDPTRRACSNFADDDGDGLVDYPDDPGCHSVNDDDETDFARSTVDIRARMLIVFDTSGSMNWNTCAPAFTGGDGSMECPGADVSCASCGAIGCGDGMADDSRIDKAKRGISAAVAAYGEVEFSLMRFHQLPRPFSCPTLHANGPSGGWQGAGPSPCAGGFGSGDLVVSFDPDNASDLREWMDGSSNQPGAPDPGLDFELRGSGNTPLAGSLGSALDYLEDESGVDPVSSCRPYVVILLTDGQETCAGDPTAAAGALRAAGYPVYVIGFAIADAAAVADLDAIAASGGTRSAIFVDDEATLSEAISTIVAGTVLVETCNGVDDDCDVLVDEGFPLYCDRPGGVTTPSLCVDPGETVCDGLDDNCDGTVDEGLLNACGRCGPAPAEVCDDVDNDCDGFVDEGGVCVCVPGAEVCDGLDNDCDGEVDEGDPGGGAPCGETLGECEAGTTRCVGGELICDGEVGPVEEICNGLDDDCDGAIDDGLLVGTPCGSDVGECEAGIQVCRDGAPTCEGAIEPVDEVCDLLDNDCDGLTDEDIPSAGSCGTDEGLCEAGALECVDGREVCVGAVTPRPETCDCDDEDCDGLTDEDPETLCPGGSACIECQCALPCTDSEFGPCPVGRVPSEIDGECYCVAEACTDESCAFETVARDGATVCAPGRDDLPECVCRDRECTFPCDGVECAEGTVCRPRDGACVEDRCDVLGCPADQLCDVVTGNCYSDPCRDVDCAEGEACRSGRCEPSCASVECEVGQRCARGVCVDDPCARVLCAGGQVCDPATARCESNACLGVECPPPTVCEPLTGDCVADPCEGLRCPDGQTCLDGECAGREGPPPPPADAGTDAGQARVLATGRGGLICVAAPSSRTPPPLAGLLLMLGLACVRARRRS